MVQKDGVGNSIAFLLGHQVRGGDYAVFFVEILGENFQRRSEIDDDVVRAFSADLAPITADVGAQAAAVRRMAVTASRLVG